MEILAGREKTFFGVAPHLNYAIWGLGTAAIAYLLPVWWHMQLVFSLPLLSLLIIYWYLPESPRLVWRLELNQIYIPSYSFLHRNRLFIFKMVTRQWTHRQG